MPKIENLAFPSAPRANIVKDFAIFELTDHDPFMSSRNAKLFARRFCQRQLEELGAQFIHNQVTRVNNPEVFSLTVFPPAK